MTATVGATATAAEAVEAGTAVKACVSPQGGKECLADNSSISVRALQGIAQRGRVLSEDTGDPAVSVHAVNAQLLSDASGVAPLGTDNPAVQQLKPPANISTSLPQNFSTVEETGVDSQALLDALNRPSGAGPPRSLVSPVALAATSEAAAATTESTAAQAVSAVEVRSASEAGLLQQLPDFPQGPVDLSPTKKRLAALGSSQSSPTLGLQTAQPPQLGSPGGFNIPMASHLLSPSALKSSKLLEGPNRLGGNIIPPGSSQAESLRIRRLEGAAEKAANSEIKGVGFGPKFDPLVDRSPAPPAQLAAVQVPPLTDRGIGSSYPLLGRSLIGRAATDLDFKCSSEMTRKVDQAQRLPQVVERRGSDAHQTSPSGLSAPVKPLPKGLCITPLRSQESLKALGRIKPEQLE
eukprot:TRINITY_DN14446_c1_g2_i1.p1 TRINITY_DN14446_c1_g2~~TRINITY_DN14446_c1_g2_i1.p1  ORF type:complete len:415 (+),score=88.33 TRINITY_DN14446_c1_g2_i1:22-1245(+)